MYVIYIVQYIYYILSDVDSYGKLTDIYLLKIHPVLNTNQKVRYKRGLNMLQMKDIIYAIDNYI